MWVFIITLIFTPIFTLSIILSNGFTTCHRDLFLMDSHHILIHYLSFILTDLFINWYWIKGDVSLWCSTYSLPWAHWNEWEGVFAAFLVFGWASISLLIIDKVVHALSWDNVTFIDGDCFAVYLGSHDSLLWYLSDLDGDWWQFISIKFIWKIIPEWLASCTFIKVDC